MSTKVSFESRKCIKHKKKNTEGWCGVEGCVIRYHLNLKMLIFFSFFLLLLCFPMRPIVVWGEEEFFFFFFLHGNRCTGIGTCSEMLPKVCTFYNSSTWLVPSIRMNERDIRKIIIIKNAKPQIIELYTVYSE